MYGRFHVIVVCTRRSSLTQSGGYLSIWLSGVHGHDVGSSKNGGIRPSIWKEGTLWSPDDLMHA